MHYFLFGFSFHCNYCRHGRSGGGIGSFTSGIFISSQSSCVKKKELYKMNTTNMSQRNDFSGHKISLFTGSLLPSGLTLNLVPSD